MADLVIIAYDTEATAEAARKKLLELQKEYLIELGDAVVAVRQPDGHWLVVEPRHGLLDHGLLAVKRQQLLGPALPAQRPETSAPAAGENHGMEICLGHSLRI